MAIRRKERLPFKTTPMGVVVVIVALVASLGLFWAAVIYGFDRSREQRAFACFLAGGACLGGGIGAVIGQSFRDEKGGTAQMGVFIGTLVGPFVVTVLF